MEVLISEPGMIFAFHNVHYGKSCLTVVGGFKHVQEEEESEEKGRLPQLVYRLQRA